MTGGAVMAWVSIWTGRRGTVEASVMMAMAMFSSSTASLVLTAAATIVAKSFGVGPGGCGFFLRIALL
jgi:hypothetical protein